MRALSVRAGIALVGELEVRRDVCVFVRDGRVESIEGSGSCREGSLGGPAFALLPQPANAHVHSADHAFPEYGSSLSLEELVAPPHGLKHRLLSATPPEALTKAIFELYYAAWRLGIGLLVDFREGGGLGCTLAAKAREGLPEGMRVLILGRPGPEWPMGCEGLGAPSPLNYGEREFLELAMNHRPAMAHVAETPEARRRGDLERALRARLDAIVHGTHLSPDDLEALREEGVGLVLCPSSNMWHGVGLPPVADAIKAGVRLALGTDNAAWSSPNVWLEARQALLLARAQGAKGEEVAKEVLRALFVAPYELIGLRPPLIEEGEEAKMVLLYSEGLASAQDVYGAVAKRAGEAEALIRIEGENAYVTRGRQLIAPA
ncbi:MAG: amidohydrolase family protein [Acidilobaceae archaeon]|nr:amidohydrolase family protein [Acidilobaceae archaeon]